MHPSTLTYSTHTLARAFRCFFFFYGSANTQIYPPSLHRPLPVYIRGKGETGKGKRELSLDEFVQAELTFPDRKSTRLNSSHSQISYAVFCLKKKHHRPPTPRVFVLTQFTRRACGAPNPVTRHCQT